MVDPQCATAPSLRSAVFEWNAITEFGAGSPERDALYGREAGTLTTRAALLEAIHPDDRELVQRMFGRMDTVAHGGILECEYRAIWPDGTVRWLRSVNRVEHRAGHARHISGVIVDITDRKFAQERLAASEARHREIADSYARAIAAAHIAPYEWDIETGMRTGSPDREALYGRPAGTLNDDKAVLKAIHPDDRAAVRAFQQRMRWANDGETMTSEYRVIWPGGQVHWLRNICRMSTSEGVRRVSGVLFDITESKRNDEALALSERRYRILVEHIGTTLWQATPAGLVIRALGWATLTGQQEGEYQGHGWEDAVHPEDRPAVLAAWRHSCAKEEPIDIEYRVRDVSTGEWIWLRARTVPVRDDQGKLVEWSGICENIDQRKRYEKALAAAKERAEQQDQAKSKFLAAASHDLRQPLQSLYLFASALEANLRPEAVSAYERLQRGLDVLSGLLDELLDLSRLDLNLVVPRFGDFPLSDLLQEVATSYIRAAEAKGLSLHVVAANAGAVRTDRDMMRRLLGNLVENAIRYTERGNIVIDSACGDGVALVSVRDTGMGIPPNQLDLIWEEFYQVANPARERERGLGLGLAIVRRLSALLGCPVKVSSSVGEGTTFTVAIPFADAGVSVAASIPAPPDDPQPVRVPAHRPQRPVILVVDDDPLIREAFDVVVESWRDDWTILVAGSASEAMAMPRPDAVVMDYRLGEETGDKAIIRLREHWHRPNLPAVLLTGDTDLEVAARAKESAMRLLHKPVDTHGLREALAAMLAEDSKDAPNNPT